jgi:hypothetical protein
MAGSLHHTIQQLATDFAAGVLGAIRGSSLEDILAETEGAKRRGPGRPRKQSVASAPERGASRPSSGRRKGGRLGRRSAGALERVVGRIVDLLSKNSKGLRAEQIRAELGLSAKELPRPIAKALESKRIRKTGQKRATTYFTGGGGAAKPAARGGKKARRGRPPGKKKSASKRRGAGKKAGAPSAAPAPAAS